MIAIIDYDMGNLKSVANAFEKLGSEAIATRSPSIIKNASHVVLPGVGAFGECMKNLSDYNLIDVIIKTIESGKPFLGICLGLQLLFEQGEEDGTHKGLGIIKGRVKKFPSHIIEEGQELKIPHIGWNDIKRNKDSAFLSGVPDGTFFYFVHSYYGAPEDEAVILTKTCYGMDFTSSISKDNIIACQFHPEKSQRHGLKLLKNFTEMK